MGRGGNQRPCRAPSSTRIDVSRRSEHQAVTCRDAGSSKCFPRGGPPGGVGRLTEIVLEQAAKYSKSIYIRFTPGFRNVLHKSTLRRFSGVFTAELCKGVNPLWGELCRGWSDLCRTCDPNYVRVEAIYVRVSSRWCSPHSKRPSSSHTSANLQQVNDGMNDKSETTIRGSALPMESSLLY